MKTFIFMNDELKKKKPLRPVIRVQQEDGTFEDTNHVTIFNICQVRYSEAGLKAVKSHKVRSWIEANSEDVVIPPRAAK